MAKNNKGNNNNNYFAQNIQRFGENFINQKSPRDIQFDSIRLFRDIAKQNIDFNKYGEYFLNDMFMNNIMVGANSKYQLFKTNYDGVLLLSQQQPNDSIIMSVLENNRRCRDAYANIINALNMFRATQNINVLFQLSSILRDYRNNI